jgi:N utilization substance protein B
MTAEKNTYRDDVRLVEKFYTSEIENLEMIEEVLEEQSLLWNDDLGFALIMVVRTLANCRASQTEVPVLPKFKNDDDREFVEELFRRTLVNFDSYMKLVERFTRNWDVERIAFMDNLIMVTALSEMINFESIPVKVSLDEYIEIAKYYSSMGSGTFINGILDKCAETLREEGVIVKSGRGLI